VIQYYLNGKKINVDIVGPNNWTRGIARIKNLSGPQSSLPLSLMLEWNTTTISSP